MHIKAVSKQGNREGIPHDQIERHLAISQGEIGSCNLLQTQIKLGMGAFLLLQ